MAGIPEKEKLDSGLPQHREANEHCASTCSQTDPAMSSPLKGLFQATGHTSLKGPGDALATKAASEI